MTPNEVDTLNTTYYAVNSDFSFFEIADLESAKNLSTKPLFLVEKYFKFKTKSYFNNEYFIHYGYKLYDENQNTFQFTQNKWTLLSINEPINDRNSTVFYKISSPDGIVRNISNIMISESSKYSYFRVSGLCNTLLYFQEFFKYPDWDYFDLKIDYLTIKKKYELLKRKFNIQNKRLTENNIKPIT